MKKGITVAGSLIADVIYDIDIYPKKGNLTRIDNPIEETGGATNLLRDLARLDGTIPLKVAGTVGDDEKGQLVKEKLSMFPNIDVSQIRYYGRSAVTYAMTERVSKQRTFFFDIGDTETFDESHINWEHLDADIFMLEYVLLLGTLDEPDDVFGTKGAKILYEAKKRGMKTAMDMVSEEGDRYQKVVIPALPFTDYCIINEVEAEGTTGIRLSRDGVLDEAQVWKALERLKDLGVSTWAVIHSPQAGYGLNCLTGEQSKVPSLKLPDGYIKGTTGAGDAYCAGVLYGAYQGKTITEALQIGTATAACSLAAPDTNSGVKSYEQTMEVYRQLAK